MAALADLAPDRRAVLQLLVGRGRSYEQIADLLSVSEIVVRRRAHDAITELAGGPGTVSSDDRMLLSDYLVGELPASRRSSARKLLADDPAARRFARAAAARLSSIKDAQLPELPDEDDEVADALDALDARRERVEELKTTSRKGAWLLVTGVAIAVTAAVIALATIAGDDGDANSGQVTPNPTPASTSPVGLLGATLTAPNGGSATGNAAIQYPATGPVSFALTAEGLPAPRQLEGGSFTAYAVWLDGPGREPLRLGFYDPAGDTGGGEDGKITIGIKLDGKKTPGIEASDLDAFTDVIFSRETLKTKEDRPERPTTVVLQGELKTAQG